MKKDEVIFWGIILLIFAPSLFLDIFIYLLPYLIIIGIVAFIYKTGKNGVFITASVISFTSLIQLLLLLIQQGSELYLKIVAALNIVSLITIETIFDLIIFNESINWSVWDHLIAFICSGAIAYISKKI